MRRNFIGFCGCVLGVYLAGCGSSDAPPFGGSGGANPGGAAGNSGAAGTSQGGVLFGGATGGGGAPACIDRGAPCTATADRPNPCCGGTCVSGTSNTEYTGCRPTCHTGADCDTGCCIPFVNTPESGFCVDAKFCACGPEEAPCGSKEPACCDTLYCAKSSPTDPGFSCRKKCKAAAECGSNCCSGFFEGQDYGVCLVASACPH